MRGIARILVACVLAWLVAGGVAIGAEEAQGQGSVPNTQWMQVTETVLPIRVDASTTADIRGFARKGQVLAVEKVGRNWIKLRANDSLSGWVPLTSVTPSGRPVNWSPSLVKLLLLLMVVAAAGAFGWLALSLHLKRRRESQERSHQAMADSRRRLQNKVQLLFRAEPHVRSHLGMEESDLLEFLRNIGYVANLEKDTGQFLGSCKEFKPNLILSAWEFREIVEGMVETDAMLINTPVVYLRCERAVPSLDNRVRHYLDANATDKELGEAISLSLKKSPGKIRYSVKPVALKGEIRPGTLVELLSFLSAVKRSGHLLLTSDTRTEGARAPYPAGSLPARGEIILFKGEIVRAGMRGKTGAKATDDILNLASGAFEFHEKSVGQETESINTQKLLLEWARHKDESGPRKG